MVQLAAVVVGSNCGTSTSGSRFEVQCWDKKLSHGLRTWGPVTLRQSLAGELLLWVATVRTSTRCALYSGISPPMAHTQEHAIKVRAMGNGDQALLAFDFLSFFFFFPF